MQHTLAKAEYKGKAKQHGAKPSTPSSRLARTNELISLAVAAVPLLGLAGTALVWLTANFFVGTVQLNLTGSFQGLEVRVYDLKGMERVFHSPTFQLFPGDYDLLILRSGIRARQQRAHVDLNKTTIVPVVWAIDQDGVDANGKDVSRPKRKWWQFWRR